MFKSTLIRSLSIVTVSLICGLSFPLAGQEEQDTSKADSSIVPENYAPPQNQLDCNYCHTTRLEERMTNRETGHWFMSDEEVLSEKSLAAIMRILYGPDSLFFEKGPDAPDLNMIWGLAKVVWNIEKDVEKKIRAINNQKQKEIAEAKEQAEAPYISQLSANIDLDPRSIEMQMEAAISKAVDSVENSWRPEITKVTQYKMDALSKYPILGLKVWDKEPGYVEGITGEWFDADEDYDFLYVHLYRHLWAKGYRPNKPYTHTLNPNNEHDLDIILLIKRAFEKLEDELPASDDEVYYEKKMP